MVMDDLGDFISELFSIFSTTTAIRGVAFIKQSTYGPERLFWVGLVLLCTFFTITDVYTTVVAYLAQPTSSTFRILKNNSIILREPIICSTMIYGLLAINLDLTNASQVNKLLDRYRHIEDIVGYLQSLNPLEPQPISLSTTQYHQNVTNFHDTSISDPDSLTLIGLTAMMLNNLIQADQVTMKELSETMEWGVQSWADPKFRQLTGPSMALVNRFYTERRTNFSLLMKSVCSLQCLQINLKIFIDRMSRKPNATVSLYEPCSLAECYWYGEFGPIGTEVLCVKVADPTLFEFHRPIELNTITLDVRSLYPSSMSLEYQKLMIDFKGNFGNKNLDVLLLPLGLKKAVMAQIDGHYHALNTVTNKCGRQTYLVCTFRCRSKLIALICNCSPISSFAISEISGDICGGTLSTNAANNFIYQSRNPKCYNITERKIISDLCNSKCVEECETQMFSFTFVDTSSFSFWPNASMLQFGVRKYAFPYVLEYETLSAKELVARLGGNLSLYIGASFIALIHVIVFVIRIPLEYNRSRTKKEKNSMQKPNVAEATRRTSVNGVTEELRYQTVGFAPLYTTEGTTKSIRKRSTSDYK